MEMTTEYKLSDISKQLFTKILEHYTPLSIEQLDNVFKLIIESKRWLFYREIDSFSINRYTINNCSYDKLLLLIKNNNYTLYLSPSTIIFEQDEDIYVCYYNSQRL